MNVIQDNIAFAQIRKGGAANRPLMVKPTIIGDALMPPPPSSTKKKFVTPSSSRSRIKDVGGSSTSHSKSTPTVHRDSHVIVSVCEGRGKAAGIVGIAAIDIHRPVLILSQISDNKTYTATLTKLNILRPVEVLVPATFIEGATVNRLITVIVNQFPNLTVNSIPRSEFNRGRGIQMIESLCVPVFNSVILQINHKFYASAASCALLRYVEQTRRVIYSPKTVKVEYQKPEHTTGIDIDTAHLLELVSTTGKQKVSLFTVLNYCATTPGKKLLRTNILQPPCRKDVIETRQDCIQELIENPNLLTRLQETLKPLSDIEASLTFGSVVPATASSVSERQLNYTLQLKGLLSAIQPLADELKVTKHPVFREIYNRFEGLDTRKKILSLISEIVNEDAHLAKGQAGELQRCFALKSGINGFLDLARRLYTEEVDNMRSYVDELSSTYNLPLRVQHTIKNGFHITLPLTKALRNLKKADLPEVFIQSERFSSHFYLNTMNMINFDKRLKNNSIEIQNISNVIIYQLLVDIRPHIGDLYHLCDDVAQLDLLVSLARASSVANWVRPRLVDTHLYVEGARHPVLEHIADQEPISNTIYAYPRCRLHIITGPNMSGKTILLHTICLLQVLSQVGCWVPCTRATLRISDRVIARVADDEESLTASSFAVEAAKLAYMLNTLSENSLVVLDEMCKTTANDEGVALAISICEKMVKMGVFGFFASHFMGVTKMADLYPSVVNWYMETLEEYRANNKRISLKFTYKLLPGVTSIDSYGIKLSRIFTSSTSIADRAEELHKYLLPMRKSLSSESATNKPEFLKFKLQAELDLLKIKNQLTDEIQKDKITSFQNKTGLSFEPSPLTIERSNSLLLDQSSSNDNKKSNSDEKKISSGSNWLPTPSNKSTISSNHQFSVPTSNKTSSNLEKCANDHIFSLDHQPSTSFEPEDNFSFAEFNSFHSLDTFPQKEELSSIHKNEDSVPNKNLLFYNSQNKETQSQNITFSRFPEFKVSLSQNSQKKSKFIFSQKNAENTELPNQSNNYEQNYQTNELLKTPAINLHTTCVSETPMVSKNDTLMSCQEISVQVQPQNTPNLSVLKSNNSSLSSTSMLNNSSPILSRKYPVVPEKIPETVSVLNSAQLRLVSNLYDTSSESENSDENNEIDQDTDENDFLEISSLDQLNFDTYLNLRQGITSTPIAKDNSLVEINNSSKYYTANLTDSKNSSILPPNTFIFKESDSSFESPIIKRKLGPQNKNLGTKLQKFSVLSSCGSSPNLFNTSSFKSCGKSSDLSKCSTDVVIGQNKKINPFFSKDNLPSNVNDEVFDQDTVLRQNETGNFSHSSEDSN